MAKQVGGILGPVRGKVSNVVGARWKETPYFRAYAIPANPRTEAQMNQRAKMTACVWVSKALLGQIINPFWDPFSKTMAGYNRFCQVNLKRVGSPVSYLQLLITEGKLEPSPGISAAMYYAGATAVTINFVSTVMGNGQATDKVIACVIDIANKVAFFSIGTATRSSGTVDVTIGAGRTAGMLEAFIGFNCGAGSSLMVSPSMSHSVASEA